MSTDPLPCGLTFIHSTDMTLGQQIGKIMFTGDLDRDDFATVAVLVDT